jgi:hypothetical protein
VADKVHPDDLAVLTEADVRFSAAHKAALEKRGRFLLSLAATAKWGDCED